MLELMPMCFSEVIAVIFFFFQTVPGIVVGEYLFHISRDGFEVEFL